MSPPQVRTKEGLMDMHYLAFGFPNDEGGYGFTIPDIQGFTADAGEATLDQSLAVVRRVLADHIAALVDANLAVPAARRPEEVIDDPECAEARELATFFTLVPAILPAGRTLRVNITMDENVLNLVDRAAGDRNLTRSAFIAEACRRFAVGEAGPAGPVVFDDDAADQLGRHVAMHLQPAIEANFDQWLARSAELPVFRDLQTAWHGQGASDSGTAGKVKPPRKKRALNLDD
jgi:predicted RNase H-like HicB family nuclease